MVKLGYVIASRRLVDEHLQVGYLYREAPDTDADSGWRLFVGDETQADADEASNFSMYNASTLVALDPTIASVLAADAPVAFERIGGKFTRVDTSDDAEAEKPKSRGA